MIERLLLATLIIAVALGAYTLARAWHLRRAGRASAPAGRQPALLYFRSDHCAPCAAQAQYLAALAPRYAGRLAIRHIDVDRQPEQAGRYAIVTLPTTLILDARGDVRYINYGLTAARKLADQLEKVL